MPFESPDYLLADLMKDVGNGRIQLPDFQRQWKWDDDRIAALLASISLGHPVGVLMMLEVGGTDINFAAKPLSGAAGAATNEPDAEGSCLHRLREGEHWRRSAQCLRVPHGHVRVGQLSSERRLAGPREAAPPPKVYATLESSDFLQAVTLLATRARKLAWAGSDSDTPGVSCKRKDILRLDLDEYQTWADAAEKGFDWAATFLAQEGIFTAADVPYRTQLVPLAAVRATIGERIDHHGTINRIRQPTTALIRRP